MCARGAGQEIDGLVLPCSPLHAPASQHLAHTLALMCRVHDNRAQTYRSAVSQLLAQDRLCSMTRVGFGLLQEF